MVGALGLAVAALATMPPPVPPMTPTGTGFPELGLADPDLLLLPIRMATTTPTITTTAMTAPTTAGLVPFFGVAAASFLEASGRIWMVSLSEQSVIEAVCGARTSDEPHGTDCQSRVAQNVLPILRLSCPDGSPAAETAAVDAQSALPRRDDTDEESHHQQAAHHGGHPREQTCYQQQPDHDLDHRQRVAHVSREVVGKDLEGSHGQCRGRRRGHLQRARHDQDDSKDQSGQQTDQVGAPPAAVKAHELSAPLGRRQPA